MNKTLFVNEPRCVYRCYHLNCAFTALLIAQMSDDNEAITNV